jgi:hypothetical protein
VPSYLVETYLTQGQAHEHLGPEGRARSAAAEPTWVGVDVRVEFVIHVPEDEICFYVIDAASAHDAARAAQRAGLDPIRVVEAVTSGRTDT